MRRFFLLAFLLLATLAGFAQDSALQQRWNLHFQATYIYQYKPAFSAKYSGPNSLPVNEEKQNSVTATMYLGVRLWKGAELYINPEIAGGSGLGGAFGMAASTNGETFRVGDPSPTLYLGRGFIRQTINLSDKYEKTEDMANQLGGKEPVRYLAFYLGKMSVGDLFDNNAYTNSPRTQFMNWTLMNNGAWDYAANTRGYTYTFASVLQLEKMAYKLGIAMLPKVANGPDLNTDLSKSYSINAEADRAINLHGKEGNIRLLGYYNYSRMGSYRQALDDSFIPLQPDVTTVEKDGAHRIGFGISADQQLTANMGVFARLGWSDGKTETWCFTEADRSISAGLSFSGKAWKRADDNAGIAIVANGLSKDHKDYLSTGGLGFQLGDGALNYAPETVAELYYSFKPVSYGIWLTGDYQFALNPGYNKDRGPVNVFSFRVHVEL